MTQSETSNSLETVSVDIVDPTTGEYLVVKDAPDDRLAEFLDSVRDYESRLREAKSIVNRELLRRLDLDRKWTRRAGDYEFSAPSDEPGEEWSDPQALYEDLVSLVEHGDLTTEAVERAVKVETVYKPQAAGLKALRKGAGIVKETVERYAVPAEKRRYVSVKRK